jgi:hypothetical protein
MGGIGILSVGAGDIRLSFDKSNPAECIRAARVVTDMLRRGFALLVETGEKDSDGRPKYARVRDFDENRHEYIIADFDPMAASEADAKEQEHGDESQKVEDQPSQADPAPAPKKRGPKPGLKRVDASQSNGVAVARTAGG